MSGEDDAADKLRQAMKGLPQLMESGHAVADIASLTDRMANDAIGRAASAAAGNSLDAVMLGAGKTILAAEAALASAKKMVAKAKEAEDGLALYLAEAKGAMAECFADTGCPEVDAGTHTISGTEPSFRVEVDDISKVPMDLIEYKPQVKKREAGQRLRKGPVPGVRLELGKPGIRVTLKKEG